MRLLFFIYGYVIIIIINFTPKDLTQLAVENSA